MKLSTFAITLATVIGHANGAHNNRLIKKRSTSAPAVLTTYSDGTQKLFEFQECIPIPKRGSSAVARRVTFLQSATCYIYAAPDCSGSRILPVGIAYPAGAIAPNLYDFGELATEAGKCYFNPLPGLPLQPATNLIDSVA